MTAHDRLVNNYTGDAVSAVRKMKRLLRSKDDLWGNKGMDRLDLYDAEVVARKKAAGTLTKGDKRFIAQLKVKGSNERKALAEHRRLMNHYWKSMFAEFKQHMPDITFEQFSRDYSRKFINNYFTRKVTRKALEYLNPDAKYFKNIT